MEMKKGVRKWKGWGGGECEEGLDEGDPTRRGSSHLILPTKERFSRVHLHKDTSKAPHVYAEVVWNP